MRPCQLCGIKLAKKMRAVLHSGWYRPVHIKSRESQYIRAMLSSRKALLRKCVDLENVIRGLFKTFGIRLPGTLSHHRFDDTVRSIIEADEGLSFAMLPLLEARGALQAHFRELDQRVKNVATHDPTPRRFQSGEIDNLGRISRAGDAEVRTALYTPANALLTRTKDTSPLKAWGKRLVRRRGRKRGAVAVDRKLAVILHRMWIDGTPYRWSDEEVVL